MSSTAASKTAVTNPISRIFVFVCNFRPAAQPRMRDALRASVLMECWPIATRPVGVEPLLAGSSKQWLTNCDSVRSAVLWSCVTWVASHCRAYGSKWTLPALSSVALGLDRGPERDVAIVGVLLALERLARQFAPVLVDHPHLVAQALAVRRGRDQPVGAALLRAHPGRRGAVPEVVVSVRFASLRGRGIGEWSTR